MSRIAIRVHNASEWLAGKSSAYAWQAVGIFIVLVGFVSVVRSLRTTMWVDEFYTYFTSHQASAGDVVKASLEGCDGAPPMYALLTRALHPVLGGGVMNLRFPATLGFCLMCGCVFAFVYRRLPALYAWVAMLFACDSVLYFATEGRAYGLVLGLIALSLVCWQAAAEGKHRPRALALFVFCMWAATALHYYAILLLIPLFAAEVVRWIVAKRLDVPMIVAFALVPLMLIPHIPLLEAQRPFLRHYWSKASIQALITFYVHYAARYVPVFLVPVVLFAVFGTRLRRTSKELKTRCTIPAHEWVLVITMALLPAAVVLASILTIKTFVDRYVLWAVIGMAALGAGVLYRTTRGSAAAAASVAVLLLAGFGGGSVAQIVKAPYLRDAEAMRTALSAAPAEPAPIVVADHHIFVVLSYYGDAKLRSRLVYAASPNLERYYTGIDTGDLLLSALGRRTPLHVVPYQDFVTNHRHFLLAANAQDWLVWHFNRSGFRVTVKGTHWEPGLFEVKSAKL